MSEPITIYVDADACPVKAEIYKVAERHQALVQVVANSWINVPRVAWIKLTVVGSRLDEADDWIVAQFEEGRAQPGDIVVTADVPLAGRCVRAGATVLAPNGRAFTADSIGMDLAVRNLMTDLRSADPLAQNTGGGPKPFSQQDRSKFLQALHESILRLRRQG